VYICEIETQSVN